ncbi:MAG TPA: hypothetical protein VHO70_00960 [Chitinispirillaceae bacterium]|nr:hypothetical protein [Chitinispirillaceae bacterium]
MEITKHEQRSMLKFIPWIILLSVVCTIAASSRDIIVIFRSYEPGSDKLFSAIRNELSAQYIIYDMIITSDSKSNEFDFAIRRWNPSLAVLIGGSSVRLYADYQKKLPDQPRKLPSLLLVTTQNAHFQSRIPNSVAINLDVPISTSLLTMQSVYRVRLENPGILHSSTLNKEIEFEKELLRRNTITLSPVRIDKKRFGLSAQIQEGISRLVDTIHIDCLILPNEPELFTDDLIPVWRSCLSQSGLPVISNCTVSGLDSCDFVSCTLFPDTLSVTAQVVRKIKRIKANGWQADTPEIDHIISIKKIANLKCIGQISNISSDIFKTFDGFVE